ncbi:DUF421 domain-containing protein [Legionella jordanis]|nr:YetF domain-containing protein [Legionella jordanis]
MLRSLLLFALSVILIRYGNRRFNLSTGFDYLLLVILGSVISRGINGSATLLSSAVATVSLVVFHRLIAVATFYFKNIECFFKGESHLIIKDGKILFHQLRKYHITEADLFSSMRSTIHSDDPREIAFAYLEGTGKISFVKK